MLEASERVNHDGQPRIHAAYVGAMSLNDAVHCQQQQQTVDAGRPHPLLAGRTHADGAFSLAMRPAENVPVYVMLPLDTVNAEGVFRYAYVPWFAQALQVLALSGVHGVAVDVWWCAIERAPRQYCWTGYKQLFEMVRACGLKLQVVLSFHACGGNVGDMAQVPLPAWILQAGHSDPDIFFTDRPRESGRGQRNKEYLSIWADDCPVLPSGPSPAAAAAGSFGGSRPAAAAAAAAGSSGGLRTPLQCYQDFMVAFRDEFHAYLGTLIEEVVVGSGPCGELRYPSYLEANGWRFPGVGEFQCYDRRALASLAAAAEAAGHPEWGYAGPHDSGGYNSLPLDTDFFKPHGGSWDTDYGNFFLSWYSSCLLQHGDRLLQIANQIFAPYRPAPRAALLARAQTILRRLQPLLQGGSYSSDWGVAAAAAAAAVVAASSNVPDGNAAAAVEQAVQQSQALLQQLLQYSTGLAPGDGHIHGHVHSSNTSSPTAGAVTAVGGGPGVPLSPSSGTAPAAAAAAVPAAPLLGGEALANGTTAAVTAASAASAAGTAVASSLPYAGMLELAGSLLQELLQSLSDISSSLQLTAAVGAHSHSSGGLACTSMSDAVAAAAAAAVVPGGGGSGSSSTVASPVGGTAGLVGRGLIAATGSSDCTVASNVSMPTVSSLQSSNSVVDLPTADMFSDSHQHLAALSLHSSRDSDMGGTGGSSSPPLGPTNTGIAQLLPPAAAGTPAGAAATAALAAACNSSVTCGREGLHADGNSSSSDMSCLTTPDSSGSAATTVSAAAAAGRLQAGCSSSSSMECSSGSSNSPAGSSAGQLSGRSSSVSNLVAAALSSPAAAANTSSNPLLLLFLQLLSRLLGLSSSQEQQQQQQHLQQQAGRQLQQQHSQQQQQEAGRQLQQQQQQRKGLVLSLKIAGVHWWYNSTSHASELTAGYYNTDTRDGYSPILELCERYNVNLTITCVEMCDAQHPSYALCGPEGLLRQIRAMAAQRNVTLSGENALPIFTANGIDATALDRVVANVRACRMASLRSCSSWPGPGPSSAIRTDGSSGGFGQRQQQQYQQYGGWTLPHQQQQLERAGSSGMYADSLQHSPHNGGHSSNGWPPPQPQQQQQHQRLLQQQQHHQQMLWFGADRMGGHQHTGSHITSNSRNFSELGTLLQVYGSGGSGSAAAAAGGTAGAGAGYCGGFWQRSSNSSILGGRCSPAGDSEGGYGSNASQQQQHNHHQQQQQGMGGKASGGSAAGGSSELLPAMRAFTFLRLGPEILQPECHTNWMRFMHRMLNERA